MTTFNVTVSPARNVAGAAALLYDDVEVGATYEYTDEFGTAKVAFVWDRANDFLVAYQRERLASGLYPTYQGMRALVVLAEEVGLNIPCVQEG